jgi:hypothetical protein
VTSTELYDFIYSWVDQVANTEQSQSYPIIQSDQNAPEPSGLYLVIGAAPSSRSRIGWPSKGDPDGSGDRKLINDYVLMLELWEVNGTGDNLRMLVDSIDRQDIQDLFKTVDLVYMGQENIQYVPRTQENEWRKECMLEIRLGVGELTIEDSSWIEDVHYLGTIPAQGRSGNHEVKNT